jgi:hypothetical protein
MKLKNLNNRDGQSLVEVLVGLTIGAILIGSAAVGIALMLRSSIASQNFQVASELGSDMLDRVRSFGSANWQNIYGLTKGTNIQYFLVASGTDLFAVRGKEGIIDNDTVSGLLAYWKFDEDPSVGLLNTYDSSGNRYDGTLTNGPTRSSSTCIISNCLNFNGAGNYVSTADIPSPSDLTISAWIFPTSTSAVDNYIVSKGVTEYELRINTSGNLTGTVGSNSLSDNAFNFYSAGNTKNWYHVVYIFSNSGKIHTLYRNGAQTASSSNAGTISDTANILRIAQSVLGSGSFNGVIDDVRIYNRVLSSQEIQKLYNSHVFRRYFSVENVCRTNDSNSTISGTAPCGGGTVDDPSTQKVTTSIEWTTNGSLSQAILNDYLTRWKNSVFWQTDWSAGQNQSGPLTKPNNQYASSTNIDNTTKPGSIRINGL